MLLLHATRPFVTRWCDITGPFSLFLLNVTMAYNNMTGFLGLSPLHLRKSFRSSISSIKKAIEVGHLLSELSRNFRYQILLSKVSSKVSDCKIPISFPTQF